uniref:Uncharacterized protein n=1 Tax=Ceratitis capitata TaxID=7213 RepID=W8BAX4_CERCA
MWDFASSTDRQTTTIGIVSGEKSKSAKQARVSEGGMCIRALEADKANVEIGAGSVARDVLHNCCAFSQQQHTCLQRNSENRQTNHYVNRWLQAFQRGAGSPLILLKDAHTLHIHTRFYISVLV